MNDGQSADWHEEYAEIQHEKAVEAAAHNISTEQENPFERIDERKAEAAATYQRVIEKYK